MLSGRDSTVNPSITFEPGIAVYHSPGGIYVQIDLPFAVRCFHRGRPGGSRSAWDCWVVSARPRPEKAVKTGARIPENQAIQREALRRRRGVPRRNRESLLTEA